MIQMMICTPFLVNNNNEKKMEIVLFLFLYTVYLFIVIGINYEIEKLMVSHTKFFNIYQQTICITWLFLFIVFKLIFKTNMMVFYVIDWLYAIGLQ